MLITQKGGMEPHCTDVCADVSGLALVAGCSLSLRVRWGWLSYSGSLQPHAWGLCLALPSVPCYRQHPGDGGWGGSGSVEHSCQLTQLKCPLCPHWHLYNEYWPLSWWCQLVCWVWHQLPPS